MALSSTVILILATQKWSPPECPPMRAWIPRYRDAWSAWFMLAGSISGNARSGSCGQSVLSSRVR